MGAVAYDPKVVTIWDGFQRYFRRAAVSTFDYVLYSNYERQVEAHLRGHIHVAWNSPLAWLQTERVAAGLGRARRAICMRDTDRDLTSVILVRADSGIDDRRGSQAASASPSARSDSPQATLIPLSYLRGSRARAGRAISRWSRSTCWSASTAITSAASATRSAR